MSNCNPLGSCTEPRCPECPELIADGPVQPDKIRWHDEPRKRPDELLSEAAATFREKNAEYGDNYLRFPRVFLGVFPNNTIPAITTEEDASRLQLLMQILNKVTRYAECLTKGGHRDSARDIQVYAAMLEEQTK